MVRAGMGTGGKWNERKKESVENGTSEEPSERKMERAEISHFLKMNALKLVVS